MPIYVFRCDDCGEKFERLQKLSDTDPDTCPNCGKHGTVHRQVTAPAFRLSGSGWYETDFKSDKEKKRNLAGDGAKPKEPSGDKPADSGKGGDAGKATATPAAAGKPAKAAEKPAKAAGD
jgi:putative FmdB family regulatory protein